jgi:hypothetical protein
MLELTLENLSGPQGLFTYFLVRIAACDPVNAIEQHSFLSEPGVDPHGGKHAGYDRYVGQWHDSGG